jgi:hypothetical protein
LKNGIVAEVKRIFIVQETIFFMLVEKFEIVETCYHYNFLKSLKNGSTKLYQSDDIDDKLICFEIFKMCCKFNNFFEGS